VLLGEIFAKTQQLANAEWPIKYAYAQGKIALSPALLHMSRTNKQIVFKSKNAYSRTHRQYYFVYRRLFLSGKNTHDQTRFEQFAF
jgi:hypothetical protein